MYQPEAQYFLYNEFGYKTDFDKFLEYLSTYQNIQECKNQKQFIKLF